MEFSGGYPFSVFVANLHDLGGDLGYFFRDNLHHMVVALRTRDVGFIASLEDAGLTGQSYGRYLIDVAGRKLHPLQFDELYAKVLYETSRINRVPRYVTLMSAEDDAPAVVTMLPLGGFSTRPVMDEWKQEEYAACFVAVMEDWLMLHGIDPETVYEPPDRVMSWMTTGSGELLLVDGEGMPVTEA